MANYTNICLTDAVNPQTGKSYKAIAVRGFVCQAECKRVPLKEGQTQQNSVVTAALAANNCNRYLNKQLNPTPSLNEDAEGVTWLNLSFWNATGERLLKFMNGRKSIQLDVFGAISTRSYMGKDGQEHAVFEVSVHDFWGLPKAEAAGQKTESKKPQAQAVPEQKP